MWVKIAGLLTLILTGFISCWSQENIALGAWRFHLSYNDLNILAVAPNRVFAANDAGIVIFDKLENSIASVTKIDGLGSSGISALAYDQQRDLLLIGHQSGLLSLLIDNEIFSINNLVVSAAISGSRKVNHISVYNEFAYLSTDFGVVVFDLNKKEVKETYRDLGESGDVLKINQSIILTDSIFLATEKGVISGSITRTSNLLDFRSWKRYNQGALDNDIQSIGVFENALHAAINTSGIFRLQNGVWLKQSYLQYESFRRLSSSATNLIITTLDKIWVYDGVTIVEVGAGEIKDPDDAISDEDGIWVADAISGLLKISGNTISYKPNGPSFTAAWRISYLQDKMTISSGGFSSLVQPLKRNSSLNQFSAGQWNVMPTGALNDITDFEALAGVTYLSSFGLGVTRITTGGTLVFDATNSPLKKLNSSDQFIPITSIELGPEGLWVANYGSSSPLHLLSNSLLWQSFSFTQSQAIYPIELMVDKFSQTWMIIDPLKGGGIFVFSKNTNTSVYLTTQAGKGGLPSSTVRSIANDRDGQVWVGTDAGVVYFTNPTNIFGTNVDPVRPIFENRFLLRDESVTTIAVDGGNRKWLGTNNGVWLFSPTGEELIYNFTEENSPILSNKIIDIAIDPKNGEVFFATDKGLISFRSDATESGLQFTEVKIFPNPVSADFNGQVAINGLYTDAIVKITDISGRMIWQAKANGGTATWNARQLNGNRVSSGMYLVFATSEDGSERHVGKIAIIE